MRRLRTVQVPRTAFYAFPASALAPITLAHATVNITLRWVSSTTHCITCIGLTGARPSTSLSTFFTVQSLLGRQKIKNSGTRQCHAWGVSYFPGSKYFETLPSQNLPPQTAGRATTKLGHLPACMRGSSLQRVPGQLDTGSLISPPCIAPGPHPMTISAISAQSGYLFPSFSSYLY